VPVTLFRPPLDEPAPGAVTSPARRRSSTAAVVTGWAALVWVAHRWGDRLIDSGHQLQVGFPPLVGEFDPRVGPRALPAVALGLAAIVAAPILAERLTWRRLLMVSAVAAAAWAVAVALVDGSGALTSPLLLRGEYLHDVPRVASPGDFLASFTEQLPTYHTHTQGHPPGMVLLLWSLDRTGLGGARWAAALCIAGGAAAVPAVLVTLRAVAGEAPARIAAPFLALAPAAIWVATTADALYAGLGAWGVALVALAARRSGHQTPSRRHVVLAATGGLLLGATAFCTYGAVLLAPVALAGAMAAAAGRVPWRPVLVAGVALSTVAAAFAAAGFWWFDGLAATRAAYEAGVASRRPYGYFLLANLAAFAVAAGPAVAAGLSRLRQRGPWLLAGAALFGVALADLSGLSKGEVERIWLPFVPWALAATCTLARRHPPGGAARSWLSVQLVTALTVQMTVRTPW
jgi:methylthioxylose transferase